MISVIFNTFWSNINADEKVAKAEKKEGKLIIASMCICIEKGNNLLLAAISVFTPNPELCLNWHQFSVIYSMILCSFKPICQTVNAQFI